MQTSTVIINEFISQIEETSLLSQTCKLIKAYEGGKLPVPIKNTYLSFSSEETAVTYSLDESGNKIETSSYIIKMNCFTPLSSSPAIAHTLAESVLLYIALNNSNVTGFVTGDTGYDSDVDSYKITCRIYVTLSERVTLTTA